LASGGRQARAGSALCSLTRLPALEDRMRNRRLTGRRTCVSIRLRPVSLAARPLLPRAKIDTQLMPTGQDLAV